MANVPNIKVTPPGKEACRVLERDAKFLSSSLIRPYPFVMKRGSGLVVEDVDGNTYLDFNAGIACCQVGHSHPEVVKAIKEQSDLFLHMCYTDFYYSIVVDLAERLCDITPGEFPKQVYFGNSGAEAVEAAIKLARYHTRKPRFLGFIGAFHGRTFGALSFTSSKATQRKHFAPLIPDTVLIPYPYCYRCHYNLTLDNCDFHCIKVIEEVYFAKVIPPEDTAAVLIEPIQGEGGYIVPPDGYFEKLSQLLNKYNILLIIDEVQSGMGRTGKWFAIEHWNCIPDMITIAKGIASGMPLGAMVGKKELFTWDKGSHATTFGGNPVCCAAAMKTIEIIQRDNLLENAKNLGNYFIDALNKQKRQFEFIGDVRGKGLMIGVEIVKDKKTKEKNPKLRDKIVNELFKNGILVLPCGECSFRIAPPLTITMKEAEIGMNILEKILKNI